MATRRANFSSDVSSATPEMSDFIRKAIREDLAAGNFDRVQASIEPFHA